MSQNNQADCDILLSVEKILSKYVSSEDRLLLAVSGGADSVGMFEMLSAHPEYSGGRIFVGHCDHGIRADSGNDWKFVRELADSRGITAFLRRTDLSRTLKAEGGSFEAIARRWRYAALHEMADEAGCRWILTGHTLEDSAETVLWRMLSGAPWYEWTGIPERRGRVLRPLLEFHRTDIRDWLRRARQVWREDTTNSDPKLLRNRLRLALASCPEFWNRENVRRIASAGQGLYLWYERYRRAGRVLLGLRLGGISRTEVGVAIDEISRYFNSLSFAPVEALWAAMTGIESARLSSSDRRQVAELLDGSGTEAEFRLPAGISLIRRGRMLWLTRHESPKLSKLLRLGRTPLPEIGRVLRLGLKTRELGNGSGMRLNKCLATEPLIVRSWQAGDRIKLQGRPNKKVSDLLRERHLSPRDRERTLVLADERGLVAVFGIGVAERAMPETNDDEVLLVECITHE